MPNSDYLTWIDGTKLAGKRANCAFAIVKKLVCAVVCAVFFVVLLPKIPVSNLGDTKWLAANPYWCAQRTMLPQKWCRLQCEVRIARH